MLPLIMYEWLGGVTLGIAASHRSFAGSSDGPDVATPRHSGTNFVAATTVCAPNE